MEKRLQKAAPADGRRPLRKAPRPSPPRTPGCAHSSVPPPRTVISYTSRVSSGSTILPRIVQFSGFLAMRMSVMALVLVVLDAQGAQQTTADGVFAADQAERGRGRYVSTCQGCHAADLSGGVGSALKGDQFKSDWGGLPLARLFE